MPRLRSRDEARLTGGPAAPRTSGTGIAVQTHELTGPLDELAGRAPPSAHKSGPRGRHRCCPTNARRTRQQLERATRRTADIGTMCWATGHTKARRRGPGKLGCGRNVARVVSAQPRRTPFLISPSLPFPAPSIFFPSQRPSPTRRAALGLGLGAVHPRECVLARQPLHVHHSPSGLGPAKRRSGEPDMSAASAPRCFSGSHECMDACSSDARVGRLQHARTRCMRP